MFTPSHWLALVLAAADLLFAGFVVTVIMDVPQPPLPSLLTGVGASSGSTDGCTADDPERTGKSPLAWSPELNRRLERDFPLETDAIGFESKLRQLGFASLGSCRSDPTIKSAFFRQHGGSALRPGRLPMGATIWWKLNPEGQRLVWAKGMVGFDGF